MSIEEYVSKQIDLDSLVAEYKKHPRTSFLPEIIEAGAGLIHYFIRLYGGGRNKSDLFQIGVEGLLKAIKRYDPNIGASFTTYAGHCIMGEIRHYIRKETSYYRPGCIKGLQYRIEQEVERSLKETGVVPGIPEIAQRLNLKEESVTEVMRAGLVSFEELDLSKISNQHLESFKLPIEDKLALVQAINKLNELQRKIIYLLFYRDMTQEQAAAKLGINQRKVSRLKEKSLEELRKDLSG